MTGGLNMAKDDMTAQNIMKQAKLLSTCLSSYARFLRDVRIREAIAGLIAEDADSKISLESFTNTVTALVLNKGEGNGDYFFPQISGDKLSPVDKDDGNVKFLQALQKDGAMSSNEHYKKLMRNLWRLQQVVAFTKELDKVDSFLTPNTEEDAASPTNPLRGISQKGKELASSILHQDNSSYAAKVLARIVTLVDSILSFFSTQGCSAQNKSDYVTFPRTSGNVCNVFNSARHKLAVKKINDFQHKLSGVDAEHDSRSVRSKSI
jgi:hypothetical protein